MTAIQMESGRLRLGVDPALGAGLTELSIVGPDGDRVHVLRPGPRDPGGPGELSSFVLAPWSNRIAAARFVFDNAERALKPDHPDGSAIHGDVRHRAWRVTDRTPVSARLVFDSAEHEGVNFPWRFGCVLRVELSPTTASLELSVTNLDDQPMPAGCGHHPYFMRRLFSDDDVLKVTIATAGRYPCRDQIPTGPAADDEVCRSLRAGGPIGDPGLDDVFDGFSGARLEWPASGITVKMECSDALDHVVVYTPRHEDRGPKPWVCVEPVTMANDAFNLAARGVAGVGARTLGPGQTLHTRMQLCFEGLENTRESP